jgi:hypothetical protein
MDRHTVIMRFGFCLLFSAIAPVHSGTSTSNDHLSPGDTIIDVAKGYALQRIGIFTPTLQQEIVHTFVSLDNVCATSPKSDVCTFASSSITTDVLELATILAPRKRSAALPEHDRASVAQLNADDLSRSLAQHHPEKHLSESRPTLHLVNDRIFLDSSEESVSPSSSSSKSVPTERQQHITRFSPTAPAVILSQLNHQQLSFDFMADDQLKFFLQAVFQLIDASSTVTNNRESLHVFRQLIVGQSIFALRTCSLTDQQSQSRRPCLVLSTLFVRPSHESPFAHMVYRLIPLPTVVNQYRYVYGNLPQFVGISQKQKTMIAWNDQSKINQCTFSMVVLCSDVPPSISFANLPCLSILLSERDSIGDACQVIRAIDAQAGVTEIVDGLWLFSRVDSTQFCQVYSPKENTVDTITIDQAMIVRMPCDKKITCFGNELPKRQCLKHRLIVLPDTIDDISSDNENLQISISNTTNHLLSSFSKQSLRSYRDLVTEYAKNQSLFQRTIHEVGYAILTTICTCLFLILVYILKCVKRQYQSEINTLHELVYEISTE